MSDILLTAYDGAILGPIAKILGWIMNFIYDLLVLCGIDNIAICIVLLTIIIYLCMLPLTVKQQKFSKLSQMMQPEMQKIQEKYKGKKDQASMTAMQQETQLLYEKYGVSPSGSCIQMLIQMPILFALYRVFYNVPAYMTSVKAHFADAVTAITAQEGFADVLTGLKETYKLNTINVDFTVSESEKISNYVIDLIYALPSEGWAELQTKFPNAADAISGLAEQVAEMNNFFGLNISDNPWNVITGSFNDFGNNWLAFLVAVSIPVLAYLSQVLNTKLMPQSNNANDQMAQQMKSMNLIMPLMSFFLCFTVPAGLGLYWIASALVRAVQQVLVNKYFENLNLDDVIAKNQEKAKKKREKLGIGENQIRDTARMSTKHIASANHEDELEAVASIKANAKPGSLAAKANMVKEFNERNSK